MSPDEAYFRDLARTHGTPLLLLHRQRLRDRYRSLARALPGVRLHYALKALPHGEVVSILSAEGAHFDVASRGELALLARARVAPSRILHTHPVKKPEEIRDALAFGCTRFVYDNEAELEKFRPHAPRIALVLRIAFPNPKAQVDLSQKFGCSLEAAPALIERARALGLRVRGLSFHVGSQCLDPAAHVEAILKTLDLMRGLEGMGLGSMDLLDIGGGFPVDYGAGAPSIEAFCAPIRDALAQAPPTLCKIAEPGRVLIAPAVTGLFRIIGTAVRDGRPWYYLDDGLYGSFSGQLFEGMRYPIQVFRTGPRSRSVLAGPTCDSNDIIADAIPLPALRVGDLVIAHRMGAYTAASATEFNSFPKAPILPIDSPETGSEVTGP